MEREGEREREGEEEGEREREGGREERERIKDNAIGLGISLEILRGWYFLG